MTCAIAGGTHVFLRKDSLAVCCVASPSFISLLANMPMLNIGNDLLRCISSRYPERSNLHNFLSHTTTRA